MTFNEFLKKHQFYLDGDPRIPYKATSMVVKLVKVGERDPSLQITLTPDCGAFLDISSICGSRQLDIDLLRDVYSITGWRSAMRSDSGWKKFAKTHGYKLEKVEIRKVRMRKYVVDKENDSEYYRVDRKIPIQRDIVLELTFGVDGTVSSIEKTYTWYNRVRMMSDRYPGIERFAQPLTKEEMKDLL